MCGLCEESLENMVHTFSNFVVLIVKLVFCFVLHVFDCTLPDAGGYVFVWLDEETIRLPPSVLQHFGS